MKQKLKDKNNSNHEEKVEDVTIAPQQEEKLTDEPQEMEKPRSVQEDRPPGPGWVKVDVSDFEPLVGTDSSSVEKITSLYVQEEEKDATAETVNEWIKIASSKDVDTRAEISRGIELTRSVSGEYNQFYHLGQMTLAGRAILIGKGLLTLKDLARKAGRIWTIWAKDNLTFIKERNRERFMLLASRKDCHPYIALGVERLEFLVAATRSVKDDPDPIGSLLKRYNIEFTEDSEESLSEFKGLVDAALNNERLRKNDINVSFEIVQQLTHFKVEINNTLISRIKETRDSGGSEQRYLENLAVNAGKSSQQTSDTKKKLQDFNSLSQRLSETLDRITQDETQLQKVDISVLVRLFEKLQALKGMLVPGELA